MMLWDTVEWKRRAVLSGHRLTVTQIAFSNDDKLLASVSRDRTFAICIRSEQGNFSQTEMSCELSLYEIFVIILCNWSSRFLTSDLKVFMSGEVENQVFYVICRRSSPIGTSSKHPVIICSPSYYRVMAAKSILKS